MSIDVWGDKPESQVSARTILEAVADLIQAHLDDPDAHLETGQALQSHKASEIIDHLATSIVQDKLAKGFFAPFLLPGSFQSLDAFEVYAYIANLYLDGVNLFTSTVLNNEAFIFAKANTGFELLYDLDPILEMPFKIYGTGTYNAYFGMGDRSGTWDEYSCGFKIVNGALYARMYSEGVSSERSVLISGITVTDYNVYRIEYVHGVGAYFYVNSVLEASILYPDLDGLSTTPYYVSIKTTQSAKQMICWLWPFNLLYSE